MLHDIRHPPCWNRNCLITGHYVRLITSLPVPVLFCNVRAYRYVVYMFVHVCISVEDGTGVCVFVIPVPKTIFSNVLDTVIGDQLSERNS